MVSDFGHSEEQELFEQGSPDYNLSVVIKITLLIFKFILPNIGHSSDLVYKSKNLTKST